MAYLNDTPAPGTPTTADVQDYLEQQVDVEQARFRLRQLRRLSAAYARDQIFLREIQATVKAAGGRQYQPPKLVPKLKKSPRKPRVLNLLVSDPHFGLCLDGREFGRPYGGVEEARRFAAVMKQVAEYKPQYRDETKLAIHLLGDLFQGRLHDPCDGAPQAAQVAATLQYLCDGIRFLADHFGAIDVHCVPGNHGRDRTRHHDRAIVQKWDSTEQGIYYAVKQGLHAVKHVNVHLYRTPYYVYQAFDRRGFFTHGDTVLRVGNPGKGVNIEAVRNQVNRWSVSAGVRYDLIATGHVHVGTITALPEGGTLITNGCLPPFDHFSLATGNPNTHSCQIMFESSPNYMVGDLRMIELTPEIEQDAELDRIVRPFEY